MHADKHSNNDTKISAYDHAYHDTNYNAYITPLGDSNSDTVSNSDAYARGAATTGDGSANETERSLNSILSAHVHKGRCDTKVSPLNPACQERGPPGAKQIAPQRQRGEYV